MRLTLYPQEQSPNRKYVSSLVERQEISNQIQSLSCTGGPKVVHTLRIKTKFPRLVRHHISGLAVGIDVDTSVREGGIQMILETDRVRVLGEAEMTEARGEGVAEAQDAERSAGHDADVPLRR